MSERLYYFKAGDGNEYGPISAEEVTAWQKQGRMNSESLVRYEDSNDWVPLGRMPELASSPPPPPSNPQSPSASSSGIGIQTSVDEQNYDEDHRGGLILCLGIGGLVLSITCCCSMPIPVGLFIALPAWVMGSKDMRKMNAGKMDPSGKGNTQGGLICGIIGTILSLMNFLLLIAGILFEFSSDDFDGFLR